MPNRIGQLIVLYLCQLIVPGWWLNHDIRSVSYGQWHYLNYDRVVLGTVPCIGLRTVTQCPRVASELLDALILL
jgi:hypothetical protein